MSTPATRPQPLADLRHRAASRLVGAAATKGSTARAADALTVLHALASSPATASDALALLHELQVHQVEVELQAQELDESRAEMEAALRRQVELYDLLPVGCVTIDARLVMHGLNQTAADMLGIGRDEAQGLGLDSLVCTASARRLRSAISSIDAGVHRPSCLVALGSEGGPARPVLASIGVDRAANCYLLSLTDVGDDPGYRTETP